METKQRDELTKGITKLFIATSLIREAIDHVRLAGDEVPFHLYAAVGQEAERLSWVRDPATPTEEGARDGE